MTSPVLTEKRHSAGFLVSEEQPGRRSRDQVTLKQTTPSLTVSEAGTVLGKYGVSTGAPVYAAGGGNTGNFTCGTVTESSGAIAGAYRGEFIAATKYNLYDPNGAFVAEGTTGVAFSAGGVGFTLTAGGTPAAAGDNFTVTPAANADAGKYAAVSLTATDGTQNAAALLLNTGDYSQGDTKVTVITRAAEVNGSELVYPSGATANQIAALNAQLAAIGIIVR